MEASKVQQRRQKISNIRSTLKAVPIIKKATLQIQSKLQKQRRRSACFSDSALDKDLADSISQSSSDEPSTSLFNDQFTMGDKIGQGAHGVVRKCYSKETGKLFAAKTFKVDRQHIIFLKQNFIDIKKLQHPNVIGYKALFFEMATEKGHLVMDYLPFPDLNQISIKTQHKLKEVTHQLVETLAYIHSHKICHRDIKPQNVLYDQARRSIILIDFGISKKLTKRGIKRDMLTLTGTPYYRAPEMFQGGGYDELVDIWALGVTIFKLMAGCTPFESQYHSQTISNIMKGEVIFPPQVEARFSRQARMFVNRLLKRRNERITAKQALKDLWFIDIDKKIDQNTKSMLLNGNISDHIFNVTINPPLLRNTSMEQASGMSNKKAELSRQEIIKSLKQLEEYGEEDVSTIYGCPDDEFSSPLFRGPT